jgi:two-component system chemotaxis response regulator CheB
VQFSEDIEAVAIGASLGGPAALMFILSRLNPLFSVPIFIVQHIVPGFTDGLVHWLQEYTSLEVVQPKDGETAKPGYCYVAPDHCHMEINKKNIISLVPSKKEGIQPSVGRLFKSIAETYGKKSAGVILTGMGKDGAHELLLMKEKGAFTIAQDEKSCVMFGMPAEAIKIDAARKILPLEQIPEVLNELVLKSKINIT